MLWTAPPPAHRCQGRRGGGLIRRRQRCKRSRRSVSTSQSQFSRFTTDTALRFAAFAQASAPGLVIHTCRLMWVGWPLRTKLETTLRKPIWMTEDGRYSNQIHRSDLPKFASKNRLQGTPDEYKAIAQGSVSSFGKYSVNEADRTLTLHYEAASFPNLVGTQSTRSVTITGARARLEFQPDRAHQNLRPRRTAEQLDFGE